MNKDKIINNINLHDYSASLSRASYLLTWQLVNSAISFIFLVSWGWKQLIITSDTDDTAAVSLILLLYTCSKAATLCYPYCGCWCCLLLGVETQHDSLLLCM